MSYTPFPQERCPHCYERFFTPYALSAHIALMHYQSPAEREDVRKLSQKDAGK